MTLNLKETNVLRFKPNTVQDVRKEYGLDQHLIDQAVDILQEWIKKQEHFVKKDFSREYLERIIIFAKGSVEKAKVRVDKTCTLRTLVPEFFALTNVKKVSSNLSKSCINVAMPELTEDNYRLYIFQIKGDNNITPSTVMEVFQYSIAMSEYMIRNDYSHGGYVIYDYKDANIMNLISNMNVDDLRKISTLYTDGYGFRLKGLYVLSTSKLVDALVGLFKQVLSAKVFGRINVLKSGDELAEHFPKSLLPKDYGGAQKSISELYDMWIEELSSEDHVKYLEGLRGACTDESLRRSGKLSDEYLGMPGSFKVLTVD